ncbi:MAG: RNA methyltransferase [Bacteroidales bacterium]|nr:RNA methyltransferase [Bacteroidales bacterium]
MPVIHITSLSHPGVEIFSSLTEAQLCDKRLFENELFIAESGKVIDVALDAGYEPFALLTEERHLDGIASKVVERVGDIPIYAGSHELLRELTGFPMTRCVLCAMRRPKLPSVEDVLKDAHRIVVIDSVTNTTNIGAIFRSAVALGVDAVLLTRTTCDPLNRRAVRVSMGTVFLAPWTWLDGPVSSLHEYGFQTAAMALTDQSIPLDDPVLKSTDRLALILGTEGDGLPRETISESDYVVRIPMKNNVDSLNVAAAAAVAFWELRRF